MQNRDCKNAFQQHLLDCNFLVQMRLQNLWMAKWCPQIFDALFVEKESRTAPHAGMGGPTFERSAEGCHRTLVCRRLRPTPASCLRRCGFWNTPTNAHPEFFFCAKRMRKITSQKKYSPSELRSQPSMAKLVHHLVGWRHISIHPTGAKIQKGRSKSPC